MRDAYPARTIGRVYEVNQQAGVTWLDFMGIPSFRGEDFGPDDGEGHSMAPVRTRQLIALKGGRVVVGDTFWALVNLAAEQPSEVDPKPESYLPEPSEEEIRASGWYGESER